MTITLKDVYNIKRAKPLSFSFSFSLKDSDGGSIANGFSEVDELDVLQPVYFTEVSVKRVSQDLGQRTDIEVTMRLDIVEIMPDSRLTLEIPKEMLDIYS
jgi:hypothetical protein